jgi:hypothetical protein
VVLLVWRCSSGVESGMLQVTGSIPVHRVVSCSLGVTMCLVLEMWAYVFACLMGSSGVL